MAYAPTPSEQPIPQAANLNRTNKEEIGCRVIRNEKDWKWGKQVSISVNNHMALLLSMSKANADKSDCKNVQLKVKNPSWSRDL